MPGDLEFFDGVWFAKSNSRISYPEDGNDLCAQIEENSFWFNHRNNCIYELMNTFHPSEPFFDIGGGNGFVSLNLQQKGLKVILVEPGKSAIENAKRRGINTLVCSTLKDAKFQSGSIPSAGAFDVVEHIKYDLEFFTDIYSLLQPSGRFYLTVPSYSFLWSEEDDKAGHFRRYTVNQISDRLVQAGFRVEFATYIFSILPIPIFLFRSLPSLMGIKNKTLDTVKLKKDHEKQLTLLSKVWSWEIERIRKRKPILFGGSCLVVVTKPG